nr:hypothetical protein [Tanacetum cinerariifolium]
RKEVSISPKVQRLSCLKGKEDEAVTVAPEKKQ